MALKGAGYYKLLERGARMGRRGGDYWYIDDRFPVNRTFDGCRVAR